MARAASRHHHKAEKIVDGTQSQLSRLCYKTNRASLLNVNACHLTVCWPFCQCIPCSYRSCYSSQRRFKLTPVEPGPPKLLSTRKTNTPLVVGAVNLRGALSLPGFDDEPSCARI